MTLSRSDRHDGILAHSWQSEVLEKNRIREGCSVIDLGAILKIARLFPNSSFHLLDGKPAPGGMNNAMTVRAEQSQIF